MSMALINSKLFSKSNTVFFGVENLEAAYNATIEKSNFALVCVAVKPSFIGGTLALFLDKLKSSGSEIELISLDEIRDFFARANVVSLGRPESNVEKSIFRKKVLVISGVTNADESQLTEVTRFLDKGHSLSYNTVISLQLDRPIRAISAWETVFPSCTWWFSSESAVQAQAAGSKGDPQSEDEPPRSAFEGTDDPAISRGGDRGVREVERGSTEIDERGATIRSRRSLGPVALVMLLICVCAVVYLGILQRDQHSPPSANSESQSEMSILAGREVEKEVPSAERKLAQPLVSQSAETVLPHSTDEVIRPASPVPTSADPEPRRGFYLQFGRFQSKQNADDYRVALVKKGIPSAVVFLKDRGESLFVVVSATSSIEDIRDLRDVVRTKGVDAVIKDDQSLSKK